jgi:zinc protease
MDNMMKKLTTLLTIMALSYGLNCNANTFNTEHWTTKNGVRVVFYQAMEVPMLDISLAFAAGSAYDQSNYGLSALTAQLLNEGSAGMDATQIAEQLADTGAQFDLASSRDMAVFSLRTLTSEAAYKQATTIFTQIINHPNFSNHDVQREKDQLLMAIEQADESPDEVANLSFFQNLYGKHPYAHPINGTKDTVRALTTKQINEFYKQYYVGHNAVLVLVGAINSTEAHQLAEKITQELPEKKSAPPIAKAAHLTQSKQINVSFPSSQTAVRLGQIGIDHQNPNFFPLLIGNYILGGGALVSRLAIEIREKEGLSYGVDSQFVPMPGDGPFVISLSTQYKKANDALKITEHTLSTFVTQGPTQQELERAKQYLAGSFPMSLASNRNIAGILLRMTFYQLPDSYLNTYVDRINAVTTEEVKRAFQQQITPNKLLLITVGQS